MSTISDSLKRDDVESKTKKQWKSRWKMRVTSYFDIDTIVTNLYLYEKKNNKEITMINLNNHNKKNQTKIVRWMIF